MQVNLIEPTLYDQTGHGYSYTHCFLKANSEADGNFKIKLWCDKRGGGLFSEYNCDTKPYFYRQARQLQKIFLYRKLLRQPGIIFISTAELWDLQILAYFAARTKPLAKIFVHFHQFKQTAEKLAKLQNIAEQAKIFNIVTTTKRLSEVFINSGFKNCTVIPCPTYPPIQAPGAASSSFTKVLYAGAARADKGFPDVVNLLKYNRSVHKSTRFEIQVSKPNSQRYDKPTTQALSELLKVQPRDLILHQSTLDKYQYQNLFRNAICLLIYQQSEYQDKFSGVALDAFYAGSPIITAKNTWMGDMAEKYQAGIALDNYQPAIVQTAIDQIIDNYQNYSANARQAAIYLAELHDPKHTIALLNSATLVTG